MVRDVKLKILAWMKNVLRHYSRRSFAILHDLLVIPIAWLGAFTLRFDIVPAPIFELAIQGLPVVLLIQASSCWWFGLYRGVWRFASMPDLFRIAKAVIVGTLLSLLVLFYLTRLEHLPRSILLIYAMLQLIFLGGSRLAVRWFKDYKIREGKRILIIGANQYGEALIRELYRGANHKEIPVALLDDDIKKQGQEIHGVRVVGRYADLDKVVASYAVDVIVITLPFLSGTEKQQLLAITDRSMLPVRILPSTYDLVSGKIDLGSLREVSIEDLLGREEVSLDWQLIKQEIQNQHVLVTGAGGSIGTELCCQIAKLSPKSLAVVDYSEYNLFALAAKLAGDFPSVAVHTCLLDVCDSKAMLHIMHQYTPSLVFHAAAFKHVPMLEDQIRSAIKNNIIGTRCVAEAAVCSKVKKFVLVSTDKAVNPTNVMGATKRVAEMLCQALDQRSSTKFMAVRFGNVLGSVGSVVPIFKKQLAAGGPLTVTHKDMERYFMSSAEACQLILQALAIGQGGETFVLDMGEAVLISSLAEKMIRLAGKIPGKDIKIEYIGTRPGERLQESLFHKEEKLDATVHTKIRLALPYKLSWDDLQQVLLQIEIACNNYDEKSLKPLLHKLLNTKVHYHNKSALQQH